ncbi:hypothetical protein BS78_01G269100 [Paspalum vaginatum]|nr:hypothetical protein BS78_01G269100 [Paspalum vaginatum]
MLPAGSVRASIVLPRRGVSQSFSSSATLVCVPRLRSACASTPDDASAACAARCPPAYSAQHPSRVVAIGRRQAPLHPPWPASLFPNPACSYSPLLSPLRRAATVASHPRCVGTAAPQRWLEGRRQATPPPQASARDHCCRFALQARRQATTPGAPTKLAATTTADDGRVPVHAGHAVGLRRFAAPTQDEQPTAIAEASHAGASPPGGHTATTHGSAQAPSVGPGARAAAAPPPPARQVGGRAGA